MLIDHNFDKKADGLLQILAGKKHAEYVFTCSDSGNNGITHNNFMRNYREIIFTLTIKITNYIWEFCLCS